MTQSKLTKWMRIFFLVGLTASGERAHAFNLLSPPVEGLSRWQGRAFRSFWMSVGPPDFLSAKWKAHCWIRSRPGIGYRARLSFSGTPAGWMNRRAWESTSHGRRERNPMAFSVRMLRE